MEPLLPDRAADAPAFVPPAVRPASRPSFFGAIGGDFQSFFSTPATVRTLGLVGAGALLASPWDAVNTRRADTAWSDDAFGPGKVAGNFFAQLAAGGGTYLVGRVSGNERVSSLGHDLMRAQILSQTVVQAAKFATNRARPDGSNSHSLPSGHSASAFATATVIQRHFGWKAGVPAYALAGYIGASRMAANRHYLSDIILGAGIGIAAARTVTIDIGDHDFAVGVSPTPGGAAVTFSRR